MKRILVFLYILLIVGLTFVFVPIFSVSGSTNFLEDHQEQLTSNHLDLISGTVLAFRNNKTSAYIQKDPLFQASYEQKENNVVDYGFDLSFYSVIEKKGKKYNSGLFVIIDNININKNSSQLLYDDNGRFLIRFKMFFNEPVEYNGKELKSSLDIFIPLYDGKSGVLFFDQRFLVNQNGLVEIDKINLHVMTTTNVEINLLTLYNNDYTGDIESDVFSTANRDISNVTSSNINLLEKVDINQLNSLDSIYYNQELFKVFTGKYNYFIYFIIVWILVVAAVTYLLFVHKYVKIILKNKRKIKEKKFEELKEKIKMEDSL